MSIYSKKTVYCFDQSALMHWAAKEHENVSFAILYVCLDYLNGKVEKAVAKCEHADTWKYEIVGGVLREEEEIVIDYGIKVTIRTGQSEVYQLYYDRFKLADFNWASYMDKVMHTFDEEKLYRGVRGMVSVNDVTTLDYEYRKKAGLF